MQGTTSSGSFSASFSGFSRASVDDCHALPSSQRPNNSLRSKHGPSEQMVTLPARNARLKYVCELSIPPFPHAMAATAAQASAFSGADGRLLFPELARCFGSGPYLLQCSRQSPDFLSERQEREHWQMLLLGRTSDFQANFIHSFSEFTEIWPCRDKSHNSHRFHLISLRWHAQ
jgi:hypothetical protein